MVAGARVGLEDIVKEEGTELTDGNVGCRNSTVSGRSKLDTHKLVLQPLYRST